jgi:hypothetical protein
MSEGGRSARKRDQPGNKLRAAIVRDLRHSEVHPKCKILG